MVKITSVLPHSRAERAGIRPGDTLLSVGGCEIRDVLDYRFYLADEHVTLSFEREGRAFTVAIEKELYDDIGLEFETPLMDRKRSCRNKCIFCFIDQLPPGMRESLYFKDDDSRLSFLHGNYITLTNLTDADIDRIIKMRFSPINVSIHTTDPDLRVRMMKNKRAGECLAYLRRLADAGITLHGQIVLCRGINDGDALMRTMRDLSLLAPALDSVSVVPAGMTRYREGLHPLTPFSREESRGVIRMVERFAGAQKKKTGSRLFFAADEFYLSAGLPLPKEARYEGYPQIENGVGMLRSTEEEFRLALRAVPKRKGAPGRAVSVATGLAAAPLITRLARLAEHRFPHLAVRVYPIRNDFFGESITVAGLLTGRDIAAQLSGKELGEELLFSENALRAGEAVFLDDMTTDALSESLGVSVTPVASDGAALLSAMLGD